MNIFEFDPEAAQRIERVVNEYPMSLSHAADILELVAPLATCYTVDGLKMVLEYVLSFPEEFRKNAADFRMRKRKN